MQYIKGDIVKAALAGDLDVMGHQTNCFCVWGSGLAPQIRSAFPQAHAADVAATTPADPRKLGSFTKAESLGPENVTIYNLYGQYEYSRAHRTTNYAALARSLFAMRDDLGSDHGIRVAFPKIGCGVAGGEWKIVQAIIAEAFRHHQILIYQLTR